MPIDFNLRRGLHPKHEEVMSRHLSAVQGVPGVCTVTGRYGVDPNQYTILLVSESNLPKAYMYTPARDGWIPLPTPPFPSTVNNGTCVSWHPVGPTLSPTSATSTTAVFTLAAVLSLAGYAVRIIAGTGKGQERTIASNTYGSPCTITVTQAWSVTPDATSVIEIRTGRFYALNAGTVAAGQFAYFDLATYTWASLSTTGLPATWGTCGGLVAPNSTVFVTGQATAGGAFTLTNAAKNWAVNQWTNYSVRITGGTGVGQRRTVASNIATALTVSSAWTIQPDNTSLYSIEANEDLLYLSGGNATTVYKYSLSGNSWSTISAARAIVPFGGQSFHLIDEDPAASWSDETNFLNGRYIYSYPSRGNARIDRFNITTEAWDNNVSTGNAQPIWGSTAHVYVNGYIYTNVNDGNNIAGRWLRFRPSDNVQTPWFTTSLDPTVGGNVNWDSQRAFSYKYLNRGVLRTFIYCLAAVSNVYRIQEIP